MNMIADTIIIIMIVLSPADTIKKEPVKIDMQKLRKASDRAASKAHEVTKEELCKLLNNRCIVRKRTTK